MLYNPIFNVFMALTEMLDCRCFKFFAKVLTTFINFGIVLNWKKSKEISMRR